LSVVKVGIFVDLRNPRGWQRPWGEHYERTLEQVVEAERLGADAVWFSEHHLFEDGYLPQPLTFAAAVAARTERIRVGTAIVVAPLRHPLHLAEEAAVVDLVSGGRLELGLGAGYAAAEFTAFGVDIAKRYSRTDAVATEVRRLLDDKIVTPPPLQRPFPIWLGYQGVQGARRAGRLGFGLLSLNPASLEPYRAGLVEGGHDRSTARMGGVVNVVVADDPPAAREQLVPFYAHQSNTYRRAHGDSQTIDTAIDELRAALAAKNALPGLAVLTPDDAITAIRTRTDGLPVEHIYFWTSIAGMPDALSQRHLELLLGVVRPALATGGSR
jgi:alkanesulfonate monooxygenase SsuD/methylene tetrahydromethanopterin reductase-like flavin-dependent oxidoreductase (luciferase family)